MQNFLMIVLLQLIILLEFGFDNSFIKFELSSNIDIERGPWLSFTYMYIYVSSKWYAI